MTLIRKTYALSLFVFLGSLCVSACSNQQNECKMATVLGVENGCNLLLSGPEDVKRYILILEVDQDTLWAEVEENNLVDSGSIITVQYEPTSIDNRICQANLFPQEEVKILNINCE